MDSWGDLHAVSSGLCASRGMPAPMMSWNLDSWEDDVPETETLQKVQQQQQQELVQQRDSSGVVVPVVVESGEPLVVRNPYEKYVYLVPSMKTTVLKAMYPQASHPLGELQRDLKSDRTLNRTLLDYILCVRNAYLSPVYSVLKSTHFYNPITRTRVPRKKNEPIDPGFSWVSLEDQRKVYQLFGFSGNKPALDDNLRGELLEAIKNLLYQPPVLAKLVMYLLYAQDIDIDMSAVLSVCKTLPDRSDFAYKSYKLPEKWFYNPSWKKVAVGYNVLVMQEGGRGAAEDAMLEIAAKNR